MLGYLINNWMDVLGTLLGLLYIYLEFKEKALMWVIGCIMPVIYIFVLFQKGVYGDAATEVYAFIAGLYGLSVWLRGEKSTGKDLPISKTPRQTAFILILVTLIFWAIIATILQHTDSTVACIDALSTALYLVALWMLSRKYIEQWWVWFACDFISTGLYIYKGVYGRALLYGLYTFLAVYGYYQWRRKMDYTGTSAPEKPVV